MLQILVQLAFFSFIYWPVSLCASQSFHPIFLLILNFSLSYITSGQIFIYFHLYSSIHSTLFINFSYFKKLKMLVFTGFSCFWNPAFLSHVQYRWVCTEARYHAKGPRLSYFRGVAVLLHSHSTHILIPRISNTLEASPGDFSICSYSTTLHTTWDVTHTQQKCTSPETEPVTIPLQKKSRFRDYDYVLSRPLLVAHPSTRALRCRVHVYKLLCMESRGPDVDGDC